MIYIYLQKNAGLKKTCLSLLVLTLIFASCEVLKPHKAPDQSSMQKNFRDLVLTDSTNLADVPWKKLFTDSLLQSLIEEALANNSDLLIATSRMKKATANFKQSRASFFPSLSVGANAAFQNANSDGSGTSSMYQIFGSSSWELDVWGKLRNTKRANISAFLESEAYKRAIQTQLIAGIASTYYRLLAYDAQLFITEQTLEKRVANVEAMKLLKNNDVITGADLVLSEANRYAAAVSIPDLKQNIYETENTLCLLLGRNPGAIKRDSLARQEISVDLKYGLPSQLLANRPDVQEAEYRFRYYYQLTNVARSYYYPALTITASGGISETDFSKLFDAKSVFWNLTGGLVQPLFNQGLNRQRLKVAQANEEEALIAYKQTLLTACNEVVNAMHEYQTASEKIAIRTKQVEYLEKSVDYTMELLKYTSSTNYTDVLTAEVNLLSAQINHINDKLQQLQAIVYLYQSLGGGWK
jgi:outer membrane protein, multidrug efflux system